MKEKILFIDRDGTLIEEPKPSLQIDSLEKLNFEKGAIPALLQLQKFGFRFVLVSNQDGLGTQSFPRENFQIPHQKMLDILQSCGIEFKDIFICPHFENENCVCRKPQTSLLNEYIKHELFEKEQSFVIGDRDTDIVLANNLGIRGLQYNKNTFTWTQIQNEILSTFRTAKIQRTTKETDISVKVCLNGGKIELHSGIDFFNHMLEQIAVHSGIGLEIYCKGDLHIDEHHSIEDIALALGTAIKKALGDKIGIARYGFVLPMDESLASCAIDFCNRPHLVYKAKFSKTKLGELSTEMIYHFFYSLSYTLGASLHLKVKGKNDHHKAEGLFKAFGRALKMAIRSEDEKLASSKGIL
ncbi:bifunctional histidinol-phosphatase/imidazoleglycerol-phosphate dehydratase HisB [Campylobacter sp. MIT 21-1685]|uniref:bifunctional histidinol-phosphatase/imidazoleglycerol-phosphate dehydratase HisB n=1 Tax=unclassified Campylobacter TaxID=2593542 RepID=UPI00224B09C4|nr:MULTISPECIES: bifunctional histidinol-phosphatase/imidazoleglycerol-phosphate dehydratase HisB [unclassified Campylobacter]MCX2683536.1 bifunctional histidinol-phosphatase/imidazoleglycerol-phosphate dehydratase HisB [Campylobacter sp. MIT 21-1684]MCX2751803.1 bifunctional histidinol-phosphatase/imidazoleglycerol-phosphate dehydratase HisB [Campylobacter sp. MIT 21-1682]MCX2808020.1 bifunctional histidinol-phosphatase/imidazoleglycerol-phosphate dehydratase HisB [Campylobacter sp. MIT 21-1685